MTDDKAAQPLRHRWRDKVKSDDGPDDAMLCHVLLILGDWSKPHGGPFTVPVKKLCEQTKLEDTAVRDRLKQAEGIWFTKELRPGLPSRYRLRIPTEIETERPLAQVRGRDNGEWNGDVDNLPDPTATAGDPEDETLPPPRETPTATAGDHPTATAVLRRTRHKKDVERGRARPVESLAADAPDPVPELQVSPPRSRSDNTHTDDEGDDQLEIAHFILEAIKGGNHEDFDTASELLQERRHRERQQRITGGSG